MRFFRAYTDGLSQREVRQLFDREATRAFSVLTADRAGSQPRDKGFLAWLRGLGDFLVGLAFKLSPARRLLFAVSLLLPLLGMLDFDLQIGTTQVTLDVSPFWFLLALAGMTLLLALELVDRLRVRDELEVARELQRDLLPDKPPSIPGYRVACSSRTANEIGGDYFDFLPLDRGRTAITVGDASGHGIGAGLLMAIANATLKTAVDLDPRPEAVLELLNRVLCRTGSRRAFMSFFYGVLEHDTGRLSYVGAGHPFPLVRTETAERPGEVEVREIGRNSLPLGIRHPLPLVTETTVLAPGATLVLFSDGIPEAVDEGDHAFGFDRLEDMTRQGGGPQILHDGILHAVDRHLGERPLQDDLTLVVVARDP